MNTIPNAIHAIGPILMIAAIIGLGAAATLQFLQNRKNTARIAELKEKNDELTALAAELHAEQAARSHTSVRMVAPERARALILAAAELLIQDEGVEHSAIGLRLQEEPLVLDATDRELLVLHEAIGRVVNGDLDGVHTEIAAEMRAALKQVIS